MNSFCLALALLFSAGTALGQSPAAGTASPGFLLLLALGAGFGGYLAWANRRLHRTNARLDQQNEHLREALRHGPVAERRHVATELHHNLSTKVSVLKWQLEAAPAVLPGRGLHEALLTTLQDVYEDVRLITHDLVPPELETEGLPAALRRLVAQLNQGVYRRIELRVDGFSERLPYAQEYDLYGLVLELLNSLLSQTETAALGLSLYRSEEETVLDLHAEPLPADWASPLLRARLDLLGARWATQPAEATGATVRIRVPALVNA
jgi:two-component system NarL family sensor kinase